MNDSVISQNLAHIRKLKSLSWLIIQKKPRIRHTKSQVDCNYKVHLHTLYGNSFLLWFTIRLTVFSHQIFVHFHCVRVWSVSDEEKLPFDKYDKPCQMGWESTSKCVTPSFSIISSTFTCYCLSFRRKKLIR